MAPDGIVPIAPNLGRRLTRRRAEGARILQVNIINHVIVGQSFDGRPGYFSFKEARII